jgi:hypothetical protein
MPRCLPGRLAVGMRQRTHGAGYTHARRDRISPWPAAAGERVRVRVHVGRMPRPAARPCMIGAEGRLGRGAGSSEDRHKGTTGPRPDWARAGRRGHPRRRAALAAPAACARRGEGARGKRRAGSGRCHAAAGRARAAATQRPGGLGPLPRSGRAAAASNGAQPGRGARGGGDSPPPCGRVVCSRGHTHAQAGPCTQAWQVLAHRGPGPSSGEVSPDK